MQAKQSRVELPDVETAVVLGGAGFVGSHLCDALLAGGYAVICVDNLLTGKRDNIAHLEQHPAFTFLELDVSRSFEIPRPFQYLFHLASPASPVDFETLAFDHGGERARHAECPGGGLPRRCTLLVGFYIGDLW